MKKNTRRKYLIPAVACLVVVAGIVYYYFFASMAAGNETRYVYIDTDDTVDSVYTKLADVSSSMVWQDSRRSYDIAIMPTTSARDATPSRPAREPSPYSAT